jgi:DNA-binding MarR family transcriptional regulator
MGNGPSAGEAASTSAGQQKDLLRPATTSELAKIIDVDRAAVSRIIHAMEKVGLVECLTPTENRDRYYRTTDAGKKVVAIIEGKGE